MNKRCHNVGVPLIDQQVSSECCAYKSLFNKPKRKRRVYKEGKRKKLIFSPVQQTPKIDDSVEKETNVVTPNVTPNITPNVTPNVTPIFQRISPEFLELLERNVITAISKNFPNENNVVQQKKLLHSFKPLNKIIAYGIETSYNNNQKEHNNLKKNDFTKTSPSAAKEKIHLNYRKMENMSNTATATSKVPPPEQLNESLVDPETNTTCLHVKNIKVPIRKNSSDDNINQTNLFIEPPKKKLIKTINRSLINTNFPSPYTKQPKCKAGMGQTPTNVLKSICKVSDGIQQTTKLPHTWGDVDDITGLAKSNEIENVETEMKSKKIIDGHLIGRKTTDSFNGENDSIIKKADSPFKTKMRKSLKAERPQTNEMIRSRGDLPTKKIKKHVKTKPINQKKPNDLSLHYITSSNQIKSTTGKEHATRSKMKTKQPIQKAISNVMCSDSISKPIINSTSSRDQSPKVYPDNDTLQYPCEESLTSITSYECPESKYQTLPLLNSQIRRAVPHDILVLPTKTIKLNIDPNHLPINPYQPITESIMQKKRPRRTRNNSHETETSNKYNEIEIQNLKLEKEATNEPLGLSKPFINLENEKIIDERFKYPDWVKSKLLYLSNAYGNKNLTATQLEKIQNFFKDAGLTPLLIENFMKQFLRGNHSRLDKLNTNEFENLEQLLLQLNLSGTSLSNPDAQKKNDTNIPTGTKLPRRDLYRLSMLLGPLDRKLSFPAAYEKMVHKKPKYRRNSFISFYKPWNLELNLPKKTIPKFLLPKQKKRESILSAVSLKSLKT